MVQSGVDAVAGGAGQPTALARAGMYSAQSSRLRTMPSPDGLRFAMSFFTSEVLSLICVAGPAWATGS